MILIVKQNENGDSKNQFNCVCDQVTAVPERTLLVAG